jgi:glycosyltransferase involved in cell wall biosynthesis
MNIAIDALSASSYGGLHYLKDLVANILKVDQNTGYFIFVTKHNKQEFQFNGKNCHTLVCSFAGYNILCRLMWEQVVLPFILRKYKIDSIFIPNGIDIFFSPARTTICIQNMEVFLFRRYHNSMMLNIRCFILNILTKASLLTCDNVITVSDFVKEYIEKRLKISHRKIRRIYHGRDEDFLKPKTPEVLTMLSNKCEMKADYIFCASKMVRYSNLHNLIRAFDIYNKKNSSNIRLLIAGGIWDKRYYAELQDLVRDKGLKGKMHFLGLVSHSDMPALFWNARLFAFPSTLEACPITLIEAMTSGSMIITSNVDPMPEHCKDAALYFDPDDVEDIASKLEMGTDDKQLNKTFRSKALRRSGDFSWEKSAEETIEVLKGTE